MDILGFWKFSSFLTLAELCILIIVFLFAISCFWRCLCLNLIIHFYYNSVITFFIGFWNGLPINRVSLVIFTRLDKIIIIRAIGNGYQRTLSGLMGFVRIFVNLFCFMGLESCLRTMGNRNANLGSQFFCFWDMSSILF